MENIFGIIGGMGPMATELFYKMLIEKTDAAKDQDHLNTIIFGHAAMPDRTEAILSGDEEKIARIRDLLFEDAVTLEKLGCRAIGVTCNTAHYFVDMISDRINIPFIHMIKETARRAASLAPGEKVGILATDGTVRTGLYQKALEAEGAVPCTLDAEGQSLVMHEIYDCVKAGKPADMKSWAVIDSRLKEMGCKKALLACTELSVIKSDERLPDFYIDPMEVMADRALEFMGIAVK
ncbi:MAG: amino acid racemase [Anaerovoracaceae bacterium]|nr:amino acid racemase [Anaerovoracaceae bacterium]